MLIGTSKISNGLERHIDSYEDFMKYAKSLVPQEFRHNTALIHNQAYFNAMTLRKATYIPWEKKKELLDTINLLQKASYFFIGADLYIASDALIGRNNSINHVITSLLIATFVTFNLKSAKELRAKLDELLRQEKSDDDKHNLKLK